MKKAKVLIIAAIMIALGNQLNAQSKNDVKNLNYDRGYTFDVELSCSLPTLWEFSTSHGYSFGNGLYVGGGAGFYAEYVPDYKATPTLYTPAFADVKYNFCNTLVSPFVSLQAGVDIDVSNVGVGIHVNPAVGLDISRFSINFGYDMRYGVWKHGKGIDSHYFKIGVGVTIL